jgi:hypothetical protein
VTEFSSSDLVTAFESHPAVLAIYRDAETATTYGRYVFVVADQNAPSKVRKRLAERFSFPIDIRFIGPDDEHPEECLFERTSEAVRSAAPKSRKTTIQVMPNRAELVEQHKKMVLTSRNELIVDEGLAPLAIAGFIVDVTDELCPSKFQELVGDDFVRHCRTSNQLPIASGVLPRNILIRHMDPVCRRIEKMPEPLIIMADPPVPKLVSILRSWNNVNEVPVVVVYQGNVSIVALVVPSVVIPTSSVQ